MISRPFLYLIILLLSSYLLQIKAQVPPVIAPFSTVDTLAINDYQ